MIMKTVTLNVEMQIGVSSYFDALINIYGSIEGALERALSVPNLNESAQNQFFVASGVQLLPWMSTELQNSSSLVPTQNDC